MPEYYPDLVQEVFDQLTLYYQGRRAAADKHPKRKPVPMWGLATATSRFAAEVYPDALSEIGSEVTKVGVQKTVGLASALALNRAGLQVDAQEYLLAARQSWPRVTND